jgi:alkylation response protein AidB-like acyl-CoA dehydrogenase
MEILHYTDEHLDFRKRLRVFLETNVTPYVDQWEKEHIVPKSAWKAMGAAGFLCPAISLEYGGIGGDFLHSVILIEEITRAWRHRCTATSWCPTSTPTPLPT